ncbi:hypothetical protein JMUB7518_28080 [Staphylococcus aureus]
MQRSLVGSEMCIRDSLYGELAKLLELLRQPVDAAVSYTHLTLPTN